MESNATRGVIKMSEQQLTKDITVAGGAEFQNLVKEGKLSQEAALAYAEKCGLLSSTTKEVFNFSVYKWNKVGTVQRLILQFDFKSQTLSDIQQGRRAEKIEFKNISSYQSEDGLRLMIQCANHGEYELDANTLDEKNKMIHLLGCIVRHYESGSPIMGDLEAPLIKDEEENLEQKAFQNLPLDSTLVPTTAEPHLFMPPSVTPNVLKEGTVEKKGHSVAFLMWPERYVKVCEGELLYYKPEDKEQALNIIPLKEGITKVENVGSRQFNVSLAKSRKVFSFRTRGDDQGRTAEEERDEWVKAIREGCSTRRKMDASLRSGTMTAKEYRGEVKSRKQKQPKKQLNEDQIFEVEGKTESTMPNQPAAIRSKREKDHRRSNTFASFGVPSGMKQSTKWSLKSDATKRYSATFYVPPDTTDVTTPFVEPIEMKYLKVQDKSQPELLDLLNQELESLVDIVLPSTTGKSQIDMIIARMGNIISALRQHMSPDILSPKSENECNQPAYGLMSPVSATSSTPSLSSEREVDDIETSHTVLSTSCENVANNGNVFQDHALGKDEEEKPTLTEDTEEKAIIPDEATSSDDILGPVSLDTEILIPPTNAPKETEAAPSPSMPSLPPESKVHDVPIAPPPPSLGIPPPPPPPVPGIPGMGGMFPPSILGVPKPTKKLKKFHCTPLPRATIETSIWLEIATKQSAEDIDYSELEDLFSSDGKESSKPSNVKKKAVNSLLDNTRSRNIEIFLPSFTLPLQTLETSLDHHLNSIDEGTDLSSEHIVALKRFQPTHEEREMYKNYTGDKEELPLSDKFLMKLITVPLLSVRLDLLFTIKEFPVNVEEFRPTLDLAWSACWELENCKEFMEVLKYVLAAVNYLNAGTARGNMYGISLKCLPKLMEFRGRERTSLLDYLAQQFHKVKPQLLNTPSLLVSVAKASEISIISILAEIEVMGKELKKIEESGMLVAKHQGDAGKLFQEKIESFVKKYRDELKKLETKGQAVNAMYSSLLVKFGESPATDSEDFFSPISQFVVQFKKVCAEKLPQSATASPQVARTPTKEAVPKSTTKEANAVQTDSPSVSDMEEKGQDVPRTEPELPLQTVNIPSSNVPLKQTINVPQKTLRRTFKQPEPKSDHLEKKTSDGKWAKRYFELEQGNLHYYSSKSKGHAYRQTINVRGVPVRLLESDKRVFEIESEKRVYQLRAKNTDMAADWLKALQSHSLS